MDPETGFYIVLGACVLAALFIGLTADKDPWSAALDDFEKKHGHPYHEDCTEECYERREVPGSD